MALNGPTADETFHFRGEQFSYLNASDELIYQRMKTYLLTKIQHRNHVYEFELSVSHPELPHFGFKTGGFFSD